jgi:hypothetical protein
MAIASERGISKRIRKMLVTRMRYGSRLKPWKEEEEEDKGWKADHIFASFVLIA